MNIPRTGCKTGALQEKDASVVLIEHSGLANQQLQLHIATGTCWSRVEQPRIENRHRMLIGRTYTYRATVSFGRSNPCHGITL